MSIVVNGDNPSSKPPTIQSGVYTFTTAPSGYVSTTTVVFNTSFKSAPVVVATVNRSFSSTTPVVQVSVASVTANQFDICFVNNSGTTITNLPINWIAVGVGV